MSPFDFVNAITYSKAEMFEDPQAEKDYVSFIINRALSYFPDTVFFANEVNRNYNMPKKWQFDFLRFAIPKRRRFSKWAKKEAAADDLSAVQEFYKYSASKAAVALTMLTVDQVKDIKEQLTKGGTK